MRIAQRYALMVAVVATACRSPLGGGPPPVALLGQWDYAATQTTPDQATLSGTLTISQQSGAVFQGSLDVTQRDAQGNSTRLSGVVSGEVLDTTSAAFDAFFAATGRHHLGAIVRDTIRGTWVEQTSGSVTSAGSFTAALKATP